MRANFCQPAHILASSMKNPTSPKIWRGHSNCNDCGGDCALFGDMPAADLNLIHAPFDDLRFSAGTPLFLQGDDVNGIFSIRSGMVKLNRINADGTQRIVRVLRPGNALGLEAMVNSQYEHDAIALTTVVACRIPLDVMAKLDRESPILHRRVLEQWHAALSDADQWFAELANGSARVRIARLLLKMRDATKPTNSVLFTLEDIGSILGMTVETASRVINAFLREGKIKRLETHGRDYLIDVVALETEAQSDAI
jgi:CRP-like cAMP-binding protein